MKSIFLKTSLIFSFLVFGPSVVKAQECEGIEVGGGDIIGDICLQGLPAFGGAGQGGLLSVIANLFNLFLFITVIFWVISILLIVFDIIRSQGAQDELSKNTQYIRYFFQGSSLALLIFVIISVIGYFAGLGNPFGWAQEVGQCGLDEEREILFRAKQRFRDDIISTVNVGDKLNVYCCEFRDPTIDGFYTDPINMDPSTLSYKQVVQSANDDVTSLLEKRESLDSEECEIVDEVEVEFLVR